MIRWAGLAALVVAMLMAACGGDDDDVQTGDGGGDQAPGEAWTHLGYVEQTLSDNTAAVAIEDADAWSDAWQQYAFGGERPEVDFDTHVVLLIGQPGNGCVDELVGFDVTDGQLQAEWLPPKDMACTEQLVYRIHAVAVHRDHVPDEFTYRPAAPFQDEFAPATIEIPPSKG